MQFTNSHPAARLLALCTLVAAIPAFAVIDETNFVWEDLGGTTKTGRGYDHTPGGTAAPYAGGYSNGTITSSAILWGFSSPASDGSSARTLHLGDEGTYILQHQWSGSGRTSIEICIHDGGRFELTGANSWFGTGGHIQVLVHEGGTFVYGTTRVPNVEEVACANNWYDVSGTAEFPHGIRMKVNVQRDHTLYQRASSSVSFGGDIDWDNKQAASFTYVIEGGTLHITDQCEFKLPAGNGKIAAGASDTVDVASGVFFKFTPFPDWGAGATVTKTGAGTLGIGGGTPAIHLSDGSLSLCAADSTYDLSQVTAASGKSVVFGAKNCRVDTMAASLLSAADFAVDTDAVIAGETFLLSTDDSLLDAVKTKVEANLSSAYRVSKENGGLVLAGNYVFTGNGGATDWGDATGWSSGSIPNGMPTTIKGAGVLCRISCAVPAVSSIVVTDGATLAVATNFTLPPVTVAANSRILFENGSDAIVDAFSFAGGQTELPVFEVAAGGKASVPGGTTFHDVKVHLYGTLATHGNGDLVIGGSAANVVGNAWYDFVCDGATIQVENGAFRLHYLANTSWPLPWVYDNSLSTSGQKRNYTMRNTTFALAAGAEMSFGLSTGNWNPNFGVLHDGTILSATGPIYLGNANPDTGNFHKFINGAGIAVTNGVPPSTSVLTLGFRKPEITLEGPNSFVNVDSLVLNSVWEARTGNRIFVRNGSRVRWRTISGNGNGQFVFGDGVFEVGAAKAGETAPFTGFATKGVTIEQDGTLRIRAVDDTGTPADRAVTCAAAPMSGAGSLAVENAMGGGTDFAVTLTSGANTATGTASAGAGARLLFADGANWAGTVVSSNNVGFAGASAATVSLDGLSVAEGSLPVRVFASNGDITCDRVDVGSGGLTFAQDAGVTLELPAISHAVPNGSRLVIASAPVGTAAPKMLTQGFGKIRVEPDPSDNSRVLLVATRNSGIMIMLH